MLRFLKEKLINILEDKDDSPIDKTFLFIVIVGLLLSTIVIYTVSNNSSDIAEMENKLKIIEQYLVLVIGISGTISVTMLVIARNRENK